MNRHAENQKLTVEEARDAVRQTQSGQYVDLFTHERHGHPATYLYANLETLEYDVKICDDGRCSCGGYVSRVFIRR